MDGFWESWITLAVARHLRPGSRRIDVGANCGYFTALFASLVGSAGRVWAWEPNPDLARDLRESIRLNGYGSVALAELVLAVKAYLPIRDEFR